MPAQVNNLVIPKAWIKKIHIGEAPWGETLYADPCICGYPLDNGDEVLLMQKPDGEMALCHRGCVDPDDDDDF